MSQAAYFGNWMVAVAEAAEVAGVEDLDLATSPQMRKAWDLVTQTAGVSLDELATNIAKQQGLVVADLSTSDAHATAIVPLELAWRRLILPMRCTDRELVVATANPLGQDAKREVAGFAGREVRFEIAPPGPIEDALRAAYGDPPEPGSSSSAPPEQMKPGGPHVLVVDDEAGARALFRSVLEEGGYRVTLAHDGHEAVDVLKAGADFDLVTLDYFMDRMNGLRVLQYVRTQPRLASVPVIMVTGASDRRIEMSLFEAGADDFIVKPIDAPLFLLRIQAVLRRRQLR